jgi:putative transposase
VSPFGATTERAWWGTEAAEEFTETWQHRHPAVIELRRSAWAESVPFLGYDVEIRRIICTTNAIESLNARYRRAIRARGHFRTGQAALKCLYLVTRSPDPTGRGTALGRRARRRQPASGPRSRSRVNAMPAGYRAMP